MLHSRVKWEIGATTTVDLLILGVAQGK